MDKAFLIPLGFVLLGFCYIYFRSRPALSLMLVATSVALFPAIFWGVRSFGPFYGGADIGAGLILIFSSIVSVFIIVLIFLKEQPWPVATAAKYTALILCFNFLIAFTNHFMLLQQHAEFKKKSEINCDELPFHCAVRENKLDKIKLLKNSGGHLEAKDGWGRTALYYAFYANPNYEYMIELLKNGADANTLDGGAEPLIRTVLLSEPPNFKLADLLLSYGANVNSMFGLSKKTSLLNDAVVRKNHDLVRYLMAKGADPFLKDDYGYNSCERIKLHSVVGLSELEQFCRK